MKKLRKRNDRVETTVYEIDSNLNFVEVVKNGKFLSGDIYCHTVKPRP